MDNHCYAGDSQIYIVVEPRQNYADVSNMLTKYLSDIRKWMCTNLLKLNQNKTGLMVFVQSKYDNNDININFDGNISCDTESVKNIGMYLDKSLTMEK